MGKKKVAIHSDDEVSKVEEIWVDIYLVFPARLLFYLFSRWFDFFIIAVAYFEVYPIISWLFHWKHFAVFYAAHLLVLSRYFGFGYNLLSVSFYVAIAIVISYIVLHIAFWLREKTIDICDRFFYWTIFPLTCVLALALWGWVSWEAGLYAFRTHGVHGIPNSTFTLEIKFPNGTVANAKGYLQKLAYEFFFGVPLRDKSKEEAEKLFKSWKEKWDQTAEKEKDYKKYRDREPSREMPLRKQR